MSSSAAAHVKIPVPADQAGTTSTGTIKAPDGMDLYFKRYHPSSPSPPRLSVVFVHGFVEYIARYERAFPVFAARGIDVIAFDQRGFGDTAKNAKGGWKTNYTLTNWPQQFMDVQAVVVEQRKWLDDKYGKDKVPLYLLGHSMGGGISIALFTRDSSSHEYKELEQLRSIVKGVVASAPWLHLTKPAPAIITSIAPFLIRMVPSLKYPVDLQPEQLTRSKEGQQAWLEDPMIERWVKAVSAFGPLEGGKDIVANKWRNWDTSKPLFIAHGEDDGVTSYKASKEVVEKIKGLQGAQAEYRGFEGGKHELMLEMFEDVQSEFNNVVVDWLLQQEQATQSTSA